MEISDVVAEVNHAHGTQWALVRRLAGGYQSGAHLIRDEAGREAVLKWSSNAAWATQVLRAAPIVEGFRAKGWPTPAWLAVGTVAGGPYQVQEFVAGRSLTGLGEREVGMLLSLADTHAGLDPDPDRDWSAYVKEVVFDNRDGVRDALAVASRDIVAAFMRLCEPHRDLSMPNSDLVHGDLNPENVLVNGNRISAVVDVEALGSGTRVVDLAALLRTSYASGRPELVTRLRRAAESVAGIGVLRICAAAAVFSTLDFARRRDPNGLARGWEPAMRLAADLAKIDL